MSDYINREDAIQANIAQVEFCKSEGLDFSGKLHIDSVINNLKHIPAADVVERKHGEWIAVDPAYDYYKCSECRKGTTFDMKPYNFCPNCGAEMENANE